MSLVIKLLRKKMFDAINLGQSMIISSLLPIPYNKAVLLYQYLSLINFNKDFFPENHIYKTCFLMGCF